MDLFHLYPFNSYNKRFPFSKSFFYPIDLFMIALSSYMFILEKVVVFVEKNNAVYSLSYLYNYNICFIYLLSLSISASMFFLSFSASVKFCFI